MSPSSCSPDTSYLATPQFLSLSMHCASAIELPIHVFGVYCILLKTPVKMHGVKWTMLVFHLWLAVSDLTTSFLTIPYLILPSIGGYPLGVLGWLGVPTPVLVYMNFALVACTACGVIALFESRYNTFIAAPTWKNYFRYPFHAFIYTYALTFFVPQFVFFVPDQSEALTQFQNFLLCGTSTPANIYFLAGDYRFLMASFVSGLLLAVSICFFFFVSVEKRLWRGAVVSKNTYQLQLRLHYLMIIQTAIPWIMLFLPIGFFIGAVFISYHNQSLNNFAVLLISTHGVSSTIAMILIHPPYRSAFISFISLGYKSQGRHHGVSSVKTRVFVST